MLEKVKMLLGISDTSKDDILSLILEIIQDEVKNYCHIEEIPKRLETIVVRMAVDLYRSEGYGTGTKPLTVSSVSRGDVSTSFDTSSAGGLSGVKSVVDDYAAQLQAFRQMRW